VVSFFSSLIDPAEGDALMAQFSGITPTSEVEAVNLMLASIGEQPVNTIDGNIFNSDVSNARIRLRSASRSLQLIGWTFNTEETVELLRDGTGKIRLTDDVVRAVPARADYAMNTVKWAIRRQYLFNRTTNSLIWEQDVKADIMRLLTFSDLPEPARNYIVERASARFQKNFVGSETLNSFTPEEVMMAKTVLEEFETETGKFNILNGSSSVANIHNRDY
jgi:hypothetical protein